MPEQGIAFTELLEKARQGDRSALAELSRLYEAEVRIMARVYLGPALEPYLDSMDLVQSVHRSLMLGLRQEKFDISSPERLLALALTMVRRKAARQWRKHQRQQRLEPAETANLPRLLGSLQAPNADPARAAQINEAIRRLVGSLDDTDRQVMELRLVGYSTAEVARQLGLDADVLRVRLSRLRQHLHATGFLKEWL